MHETDSILQWELSSRLLRDASGQIYRDLSDVKDAVLIVNDSQRHPLESRVKLYDGYAERRVMCLLNNF